MTVCVSFPPLADSRARVMILGSMPGGASLAAAQYYAHPRNLFWPIMGELAGAHPALPYDVRVQTLLDAGIAVWDVLQSCVRPGSLDADISDEVPNDFSRFFTAHPDIHHVFFNGAKAEASFRRSVLPALDKTNLAFTRLPSTSPAHAGMRLTEKLDAWRVIIKV